MHPIHITALMNHKSVWKGCLASSLVRTPKSASAMITEKRKLPKQTRSAPCAPSTSLEGEVPKWWSTLSTTINTSRRRGRTTTTWTPTAAEATITQTNNSRCHLRATLEAGSLYQGHGGPVVLRNSYDAPGDFAHEFGGVVAHNPGDNHREEEEHAVEGARGALTHR